MAIEISCDECGNKYRVSDDKAGAKVRCKECGAKIEIPDPDADFEPRGASRARSGTKKKRRGGSDGLPMGAIIGVAAAVVVFVAGIIVYSSMRKQGAPELAQNAPAAALPNQNLGQNPAQNPAVANGALPAATTPAGAPASALPSSPNPAAALPATPATAALPSSTPGKPLPGDVPIPPPAGGLPGAGMGPDGKPMAAPGFGGFAGKAGAADVMPQHWTVKVDPSTVDTTVDATKPIVMKMPKGSWNTSIVFPVTPSVFVALGDNGINQPVREIWNLATRTKTGNVTNKLIHIGSHVALSPDGQYLAANLVFENGVQVWSTKGNKPLGQLKSPDSVKYVLFSDATHLIGLCKNSTAQIWKLPSGELEREIPIGNYGTDNAVAVSPGGKYLAVVMDKTTLNVYDLTNGEVAGELTMPFGDDFFAGAPNAMAFSPDGKELAIVVNMRHLDKAFNVFDMEDGKLLTKVPLADKGVFGTTDQVQGNRLQWFPDRSKLLWLGHHVLDARIGGPVWSAPDEAGSSNAPRKLLGDKTILVAIGGHQNPRLATSPVPLSEIDAAAKVVAAGGEASDGGMPSLQKADLSSVTPIATTAMAAWSMTPDPSASGKAVKNSIPLPPKAPSIGGVFMSRPADGKAAVWYTDNTITVMQNSGLVRHSGGVLPGGEGTSLVEVYDVTSGKVLNSLPIPYPSVVLNVSPDGELAAVRAAKPNGERIDIYSLKDGKPVAGWKPYTQTKEFQKDVNSAVLLDSQYCVTESASGTSFMWKMPECKAIWQLDDAYNLCLSPGGKYLGFQSGNRYVFMEPRTGTLVGAVDVGMGNILCAFHPLGTHLALMGSDAASRRILIIDVATGKPTADFLGPNGHRSIQWCGDENLLLDGTWLVNLKQQKNAWTYGVPFGLVAKNHPDGRHWFVVGAGAQDQLFLSGVSLPEKPVAEKIAATQLPDESLLKPGMQINLQVTANSPYEPNLAAEVMKNFREGMQQKGFQVGAGGPYSFVIATTQSSPGGNMEFKPFGGRPGNPTSVPIVDVACEVSLQGDGQTLWKNSMTFTNKTFGIQFLKEGEDIATTVNKQLWEKIGIHLKGFPVPTQVFGEKAGGGMGRSALVPGGTQIAP